MILKKKIKILYSPLHGAGGTVIPKLLNEEGYDLVCYEPQMIHDPNFSNTPLLILRKKSL